MGSSSNLLGFCILILLVCNVNRCESISCSCKQHERNALLHFQKAHIPKGSSISIRLKPWSGDDYIPKGFDESWSGDDCCTWEGVGCSNLTCHVVSLDLRARSWEVNKVLHPATMNDILTSTLTQLKNLEYLDLRGNLLSRRSDDTPKEFNGKVMMNQLRYLDLSRTGLQGQIPHQLGNLSNLQVLDLSYNTHLYDHKGFRWVFGLRKLQSLNLAFVDLSLLPTNSILELHRLSTLQELILSDCQLSQDQFLQFLSNSTFLSTSSLKFLDLSSNHLESPIPNTLSNLSSLQFLSLKNNQLNSIVPSFLGSMISLQQLDLSSNKFSSVEGGIIGLIEGLFGLKYLDLSNNSLQESLTSHPLNFSRCSKYDLELLDLSHNHIRGGIKWLGNFSALKKINLYSNSFSGNFPESIIRLPLLTWLNLANNQLSGTIPAYLGRLSSLWYLDLSDNIFSGTIPSTLGKLSSLQYLDMSNNKLTGVLPDHIDRHWPSLQSLQFAYNHLNGTIPISLCNFQDMKRVNMKSNRFSGQIPDCSSRNITIDWEEVDLSSNSLSGSVPSFLWELPQILLLNLSNNTLEGELPVTISESLQILDLGENDFYGKIPSWHQSMLDDYLNLMILRLRSNHLVGMVPLQMCSFDNLQIIDLANNHLTGPIPKCIGNLSGMRSAITDYTEFYDISYDLLSSVEAIKGIEREYTTNLALLVNLDLSRNNFSGSIPVQLTKLQGLIGLNVSHNQLTGKIPSQIGKMKSMESLDLSDNNLQGTIPQGLADLTSLSSLNLSYNKLYGPIPTGSQMSNFIDPSIYAGNANLCGGMFPKKCSTDHEKKPTKMAIDEDHNGNDPFEKLWFPCFVVLGTIIGFWGVIGILNVKQRWRFAYLRLGDEIADWIYARWMVKKLK